MSSYRSRVPDVPAEYTPALLKIGLSILLCLVILGCGGPAVQKVNVAAARAESKNNLKQLGLAINSYGEVPNNKLPPAYGTCLGKTGSLFFHILSRIEGERALKNPTTESYIKSYHAPLDESNPGVAPGLTSYASNSTLFTGNASFPSCFGLKGTTQTILFVERYAVTGGDRKHLWAGENTSLDIGLMKVASCKIQFDTSSSEATDLAAHGFSNQNCLVGLGDGTVKDLSRDMNDVIGKYGTAMKTYTVFNWAGDPIGATAAIPAPANW